MQAIARLCVMAENHIKTRHLSERLGTKLGSGQRFGPSWGGRLYAKKAEQQAKRRHPLVRVGHCLVREKSQKSLGAAHPTVCYRRTAHKQRGER